MTAENKQGLELIGPYMQSEPDKGGGESKEVPKQKSEILTVPVIITDLELQDREPITGDTLQEMFPPRKLVIRN